MQKRATLKAKYFVFAPAPQYFFCKYKPQLHVNMKQPDDAKSHIALRPAFSSGHPLAL